MRKILRTLRQKLPAATIETTGGNHYRVTLANGSVVIVSNSPSCRNFLRIAMGDARRQMKKGEQHR